MTNEMVRGYVRERRFMHPLAVWNSSRGTRAQSSSLSPDTSLPMFLGPFIERVLAVTKSKQTKTQSSPSTTGSMNHRFQTIQKGTLTHLVYKSRWSVDPLIENIRRTWNMTGFSFGQKRDPYTSIFKKNQASIVVTPSINPRGYSDPQATENKKKLADMGTAFTRSWPRLTPRAAC
ncbi:hypothetical protein EDC04DRAFT_2603329 [Pisolithus marmoratus]|nr:hypothetical protein EDC04DRAFT_2603329 [Pisolithus marmoratus]